MDLKQYIRVINNFPRDWISFKDITPLLSSPEALQYVIDEMVNNIWDVDKIIWLDARGFIFWSIISYKLWVPFVPVRKIWKLPYDTLKVDYHLEYGIYSLEIHTDAIHKWEKVAIIDDLLATWWTARASVELVEQLWWIVDSVNFVIELTFLHWKEKFDWYKINTLLEY